MCFSEGNRKIFHLCFITIALAVPSSIYSLRKHHCHSQIMKFVVCPKCHKLYRFDKCVILSRGQETSKTCDFVRFPNHPQVKQRSPCGATLLKTVFLPSGRRLMYPLKTYPYKSLSSSLQEFLLRPEFVKSCHHWKSRTTQTGFRADVYDGNIWRDFQVVNDKPFLSSTDALSLGLMLNVDWFQPYKHSSYSVGAIYLTIMNLPRSICFKRENVILIGIIPGPSEPKHNINSYIEPLVEELIEFWEGIPLKVHSNATTESSIINVRCALLSVACDLPAGRKLCGFLAHSAKLGCSKCLKEFHGVPGSMDYSGFDRSAWRSRNNNDHREKIQRVCQGRTKTEQSALESQFGCRFSSLLKLSYFDAPRMLVVDPMHNLFLGTAKHMLQYWLQNEIIPRSKHTHIQNYVDSIAVPSGVGRIPHKIASSFSGFTADQFKNWVILFSIPSLYGILPPDHFECWRHFALACRILCKQQLCQTDIIILDALLIQFCQRVQALYGHAFVTPNMHMHGHLKEVIEDYGPVFGFWLFSYERYNGILGNQSHNNRDIEYQLLNRFVRDNLVYAFEFPHEFQEDFRNVCCTEEFAVGSLHDTAMPVEFPSISVETPSHSRRCILDHDDMACVLNIYEKLKHVRGTEQGVTVNAIHVRYTTITYQGFKYNSSKSRQQSQQFIALAEWDPELFGPPPTPISDQLHPDAKFRPVRVKHYIKVYFNLGEKAHDYLLLAVVSWLLPHPLKNILGKPAEVWHHSQYESGGVSSFLPLQYLKSRCTHSTTTVRSETLMVVVPLVE